MHVLVGRRHPAVVCGLLQDADRQHAQELQDILRRAASQLPVIGIDGTFLRPSQGPREHAVGMAPGQAHACRDCHGDSQADEVDASCSAERQVSRESILSCASRRADQATARAESGRTIEPQECRLTPRASEPPSAAAGLERSACNACFAPTGLVGDPGMRVGSVREAPHECAARLRAGGRLTEIGTSAAYPLDCISRRASAACTSAFERSRCSSVAATKDRDKRGKSRDAIAAIMELVSPHPNRRAPS